MRLEARAGGIPSSVVPSRVRDDTLASVVVKILGICFRHVLEARSSATLALGIACFLVGDVSAQPKGLAPAGSLSRGGLPAGADPIPYRTLTRSDFRGVAPPPQFARVRDRLGAATCAYILLAPEARLETRRVNDGDALVYQAVPSGLAFYARMDRACSWWNASQSVLAREYVLEHEQIHFALFEIEARRLDARSGEIAEAAITVGDTAEEAAAASQEALENRLRHALRAVLERNAAFDEETSHGEEPERQRKWYDRITRELRDADY